MTWTRVKEGCTTRLAMLLSWQGKGLFLGAVNLLALEQAAQNLQAFVLVEGRVRMHQTIRQEVHNVANKAEQPLLKAQGKAVIMVWAHLEEVEALE